MVTKKGTKIVKAVKKAAPKIKVIAKAKAPAKKVVAKKVVAKKVIIAKTKPSTAKKTTIVKSAVKKTEIKKPEIKKIEKKMTVKNKPIASPIKKAPTKKIPETKQGSLSISLMGIEPYQEKSNEAYMNERQIVHLRKILQRWQQVLMQEVDHTVSHMRDEVSLVLADPNDRASREEVFNLELRTRDREGKLLKKIEEALERLDREGEYGYCEACGVEIGVRRLEARPTATLCIDCKTLDEIKERQRGG